MAETFANEFLTTLKHDQGLSDGTIYPNGTAGAPGVAGNFRLRVGNEIQIATTTAGTAWPVLRGQESTSAAAHNAGGTVTHVLTAGVVRPIAVPPSASVYNNANISIPNITVTALTFNSEDWDTEGIHSTASDTDRLTCVTPGRYHIWANVAFAGNATGNRFVNIYLNGLANSVASAALPNSGAAVSTRVPIATEWVLSAGDYLLCAVYQDSGGDLNVLRESLHSPRFGMTRVGDS